MDAVPYVPAPVQTATHLSSLDDLVLQKSQCGIFATADKRTLATDGHAEHPNKDMALAFHRRGEGCNAHQSDMADEKAGTPLKSLRPS